MAFKEKLLYHISTFPKYFPENDAEESASFSLKSESSALSLSAGGLEAELYSVKQQKSVIRSVAGKATFQSSPEAELPFSHCHSVSCGQSQLCLCSVSPALCLLWPLARETEEKKPCLSFSF